MAMVFSLTLWIGLASSKRVQIYANPVIWVLRSWDKVFNFELFMHYKSEKKCEVNYHIRLVGTIAYPFMCWGYSK